MKLILTKHAGDKMSNLSINLKEIEKTISYGSKIKQTEGYLSCYKTICVAYKIIERNVYKVKTIYYRR